MKKRSLAFKFIFGFLVLLAAANLIILLTDTTYIYKALVYQQADIDDIDIFYKRKVNAGNFSQPWPNSKQYSKTPLTDTLRRILDEMETGAFLVIRKDSIVYEEYWDKFSPQRYSNPFSVTKSIVGILVGIAIGEGKIKSIDDPVAKYLPEFKEGDKAKITVRHLLQMASGLNFTESYNTPFNATTESYYGKNLHRMVDKLKVTEKPGTVSRYKSGDTQILGFILAKATGKTLSEYASEKLWRHLGVKKPAYWSLDDENGNEKAFCCFYTNVRDLAKIGKMVLQKGQFNGRQLVDSNYLKLSLAPNNLPDGDGKKTDYYGYQWWMINRNGVDVKYARGLGGQYLFIIPSKDMLIVRMGRKRSSTRINGTPIDILVYLDEVLALYGK